MRSADSSGSSAAQVSRVNTGTGFDASRPMSEISRNSEGEKSRLLRSIY